MAIDVPDLMTMSQQQLDDLFRASPAGDIPNGEAQGTAIIAPGTKLEATVATFIHIFAWQGKVFDAAAGELRNRILPMGLHAIIAKVYQGTSWFDGQGCIVLDYSKTSLVAHWIRDEIRLVGPGVYLGIVYFRPECCRTACHEFFQRMCAVLWPDRLGFARPVPDGGALRLGPFYARRAGQVRG
jgi:hypothetical protein